MVIVVARSNATAAVAAVAQANLLLMISPRRFVLSIDYNLLLNC
jgi:hypothetical protein